MITRIPYLAAAVMAMIAFSNAQSEALGNFKQKQMKYPRVREAYSTKEKVVLEMLARKNINVNKLEILIKITKENRKLEVWAKESSSARFEHLVTYPFSE